MNLNSLQQKIVLGTVQLGLPYGINNRTGKPESTAAAQILDSAVKHNIRLLDSAEAYGESLSVIGRYLAKDATSPLRVISKFIGDDVPLEKKVAETLAKIGVGRVYAYMFHRVADYQSGKYKAQLLKLRDEGNFSKLGISLYSAEELESVVYDREIAVVQLPFNPVDASSKKKYWLEKAKDAGKEIHVRSVFLQGLFFMKEQELTGNLKAFAPMLRQLHAILRKYTVNVRQACLNYALHQSAIDYVVIGVETQQQLEENLDAIMTEPPEQLFSELERMSVTDTALLNPGNWRP